MKIVIPGAGGMQGWAAIAYLLEQDDVSEIRAVDMREDILKEIAAKAGDKRLTTRYLDLTDYDASVKEFKGYDIVLNCALTLGGYVKTTRAALESGANYLDLTTKGERETQKTLDKEFKKKGTRLPPRHGCRAWLDQYYGCLLDEQIGQSIYDRFQDDNFRSCTI